MMCLVSPLQPRCSGSCHPCQQPVSGNILLVARVAYAGRYTPVTLQPGWLKHPGYIEALLACLRQKHQHILGRSSQSPLFYVVAGSRMNSADFTPYKPLEK